MPTAPVAQAAVERGAQGDAIAQAIHQARAQAIAEGLATAAWFRAGAGGRPRRSLWARRPGRAWRRR
jgi:hypothetical protein